MTFLRCAALSVALTLPALPGYAAGTGVQGSNGIVATIDEKSGRYEVRSNELKWVFAGNLGGAAADVSVKDGQDRLGAFRELSFCWRGQGLLCGSHRDHLRRPGAPVPNHFERP